MRKLKPDGLIITNICIVMLLLFVCYKIVIYESHLGVMGSDIKNLMTLYEDANDMPVPATPTPTPVKEAAIETPEPEKIFRIYISGLVKSPGMYSLKEGSRIADLLEKAGGATEGADLNSINLAAYVEDGRHVRIPSVEEGLTEDAPVFADVKEEPVNTANTDSQMMYEKPAYTGIVNINSADATTLMSLPGIGEVTAQNIIDYREQNGGFKSIEEIKNVPRIGDTIYTGISSKISIE
ncbi:MAG: ComEA family DNA-binding protein [Clostridiales bacterium]|jgi:competence protein ComEA|nr:ComEA family DNA-binding protein [Clostridiales bacterium]